MAEQIDITICGTGSFAARIICDLAATAARPMTIGIAGRNVERLAWLETAANARAFLYGTPARFVTRRVDLMMDDGVAAMLTRDQPRVLVQAASAQPSSVISAEGDAWSRLVAEGGLSATAVFQAHLSLHVARTLKATAPASRFINACFPDVVNSLIAAAGQPITCGVGNIQILSNAFAGAIGPSEGRSLKLLAHYQTLGAWRRPPAARSGPAPRVWLGDQELHDVYRRFAAVQLTPAPAIEISGAGGVPLMLAMAAGTDWVGHAPGPNGLPGGYPVAYRRGKLDLDLPHQVTAADAIGWNARFEAESGLVIDADGNARYTGRLREALQRESPDLARGFAVADLDAVYAAMVQLRARLQGRE